MYIYLEWYNHYSYVDSSTFHLDSLLMMKWYTNNFCVSLLYNWLDDRKETLWRVRQIFVACALLLIQLLIILMHLFIHRTRLKKNKHMWRWTTDDIALWYVWSVQWSVYQVGELLSLVTMDTLFDEVRKQLSHDLFPPPLRLLLLLLFFSPSIVHFFFFSVQNNPQERHVWHACSCEQSALATTLASFSLSLRASLLTSSCSDISVTHCESHARV